MIALWEWLKANWMWLVLIHFAYQGVAALGEINHWLKYVLKAVERIADAEPTPRTAAPLPRPQPGLDPGEVAPSKSEAGSDA